MEIFEVIQNSINRVNSINSIEEFDAPHLTEQNFNKAIVDGLFNEVYDQAGITKYLQDLKKSIYENPDTDIEKAKKDLNKLIKVYKVDSTGKRNAYWVKRGEEPKGSERETSMKELWWKLNKEEKNEYLTISRSNDSKRIEDFKQRMLVKYSGKTPKLEEKPEKEVEKRKIGKNTYTLEREGKQEVGGFKVGQKVGWDNKRLGEREGIIKYFEKIEGKDVARVAPMDNLETQTPAPMYLEKIHSIEEPKKESLQERFDKYSSVDKLTEKQKESIERKHRNYNKSFIDISTDLNLPPKVVKDYIDKLRSKEEPKTEEWSAVENKIDSLTKSGFIVKKEIKEPTISGGKKYSNGGFYWKIQDKNSTNGYTGIGYSRPMDGEPGYFYHNSHSGTIEVPSQQTGSTWNHSSSDRPGPGGWYTFDENYVMGVLNNLKTSKVESDKRKKEEESKKLVGSKYKEGEIRVTHTVDDYEHEGDTDRDKQAFRTLGFSILRTYRDPEDTYKYPPKIEMSFKVNQQNIESALQRAKSSIESAKRSGNYGGVPTGVELFQYLKDYDKKNGTSWGEKYSPEFDKLYKLYQS